MSHRLSVVLWSLATAATAQQVSMQPVAVSPLSVTAVAGSVAETQTTNLIPSILATGAQDAAGNNSLAVSNHLVQEYLGVRRLRVEQHVGVTNTSTQPVAATASADIRLDLSATVPTTVQLELAVQFQGTPGAPLPTVLIDVGDDGSVDYQGLGWGLGFPVVPVGSTAFPIRVTAVTQIAAPGLGSLRLDLTVRPANAPVLTQEVAGCAALAGTELFAAADFDRSLTFSAGVASSPLVLVLGLAAQPVVLAPLSVPCILWPSPDILVPMAPAPSGYPTFVLPLPPAVLPVTFWAQAVLLEPIGFLPTAAFRVEAN